LLGLTWGRRGAGRATDGWTPLAVVRAGKVREVAGEFFFAVGMANPGTENRARPPGARGPSGPQTAFSERDALRLRPVVGVLCQREIDGTGRARRDLRAVHI